MSLFTDLEFPDLPDALCAEIDPELWHAPISHAIDHRAAKLICGTCPERLACLTYALDNRVEDGIWGGLNATERARLTLGGVA